MSEMELFAAGPLFRPKAVVCCMDTYEVEGLLDGGERVSWGRCEIEGIAKAKAAGVYRGRKPSVPVDDVRRLHEAGTRPSDIAKQLGIGRASV